MSYGVYKARGDYGVYRRGRGDPILGLLAGAVSLIPKVGGVVSKLGGLFGKAGAKVGPALPGIAAGAGLARISTAMPGLSKMPGVKGALQRLLPGGETGYYTRRRRMNPANPRALARAIRRVNSFGSLVARSKKSVAKANRALNPGRSTRRGKVC